MKIPVRYVERVTKDYEERKELEEATKSILKEVTQARSDAKQDMKRNQSTLQINSLTCSNTTCYRNNWQFDTSTFESMISILLRFIALESY